MVCAALGVQFEEVRASRDGQRLTLTLPNSRCVRAGGEAEEELAGSPGTIPDIDVRGSSLELPPSSSPHLI